VSAGVDEARELARKSLELLLSKYTGAMSEGGRKQALKGLEHLFPEENTRSELEVSR
jgi:hypothetical protein